jgi:hypothetical protein
MRDPPTIIDDPLLEPAIEETRQFIERQIRSPYWRGDPNTELISELRTKIREIEAWNDEVWPVGWNKNFAVWQLFEEAKKRLTKPKRNFRNLIINLAADRLVKQGYDRTRNLEKKSAYRESAGSIITEALRRLRVQNLSEKQINDILGQKFINPIVREFVRE